MARERKKKNKLRGMRTHGAGNKKNHRGKGVRGGVGKAGSHKHKFSKYYLDFGVKSTFKAKAKGCSVNVEFIQSMLHGWLAGGKAKKDGEFIVVDGRALGFAKVLGRGEIAGKIRLENARASKGAAQKISAAGGIVPGFIESADEDFEPEDEEGEEAEKQ